MKWVNDIRIAYKMLILVVIAGISLAIVGFNGYNAIRKANSDMDIMYAQKLQAVYRTGEAKYIMRNIQTRVAFAMTAQDPARMKTLHEEATKAKADYVKNWAVYEEIARKIPETSVKLDAVDANWKLFDQLVDETMTLNEKGQRDEALALYNAKGIKIVSDLRDQLDELQQIANTNAGKIYQENDADSQRAGYLMLFKSIAALVILILTSIWISKEITKPLHVMMQACEKLRDGDFRVVPRQVTRGDEFGRMADVLVVMRDNLNKLMHQTNDSSDQIAAASEELTASSNQSAQASGQVAQSVSEAAGSVALQQQGVASSTVAVQRVTASVGNLREEAGRVAEHASAAFDKAVEGGLAINASVDQIKGVEGTVGQSASIVDKLGQRSQEIGQIVETIAGIAGQTNLLALNAAIEAARAGEHGRGFAVVAEEVRKLAEQSQTAAQQIAELIAAIQSDTDEAVASMQHGRQAVSEEAQSVERLRETFEQISNFVDGVSSEVKSMADAIKEVAADTGDISNEVAQIDAQGQKVSTEMESVSAATEEQSASAEEIASASDSLAKLAQDLQASLRRFQF